MTTTLLPATSPASQLIAAEIRAEMGRQSLSQRGLAARMGFPHTRLSRRIGIAADVELTFVDVLQMTEALGVSAERFLAPLLPRLDSNQQPSGYLAMLLSDQDDGCECDPRHLEAGAYDAGCPVHDNWRLAA